MQKHESKFEEVFISLGYRGAQPLAAGMESAVYRLGCGRIGKIWAHRSNAELERLQRFYRDVASHNLPFRTPEIHEILAVGGGFATIETELEGEPLSHYVTENDSRVSSDVLDCLIGVLRGLATVRATKSLRDLSVLDEIQSPWQENQSWNQALLALIQRRVEQFGDQLRRHVSDIDDRLARINTLVALVQDVPPKLIHGDIFPANILVDDSLRPVAVLDFGFLSTAGDPAFDAAVACGIFEMYGPHGREIEAQIDDAVSEEFGYSPETLILYKAAYAVITSNAYSPDGADGHFEWCVRMLQRDDVTALLRQ